MISTRPRAFAVWIAVLGLFAGTTGRTDEPGPRTEPARPSTLEEAVRVRLFEVNFIATDKRGRPIPDLRADEVQIVDHGERQRVAFVRPYYREASAVDDRDVRAAAPADEAAARPGPEPPAPPGRWLVLFFDCYASDPGVRIPAIEAARSIADERLRPGDQVAVVVFDGELRILTTFTDDPAEIDEALVSAMGYTHHAPADRHAALDQLVQGLKICREVGRRISICAAQRGAAYEDEARREARTMVDALTHLLTPLAAIPDAKMLVLFGNGFSRTPSGDVHDAVRAVLGDAAAFGMVVGQDYRMDLEMDALVAAATRARTSIFAVNGRVGGTSVTAERGAPLDTRSNPFQVDVYERFGRNTHAALEELAARTGGTARRTPDFQGALSEVTELSRGLYTAGYYPSREVPSAPHDVKIRVLRKGARAIRPRQVPAERHLPTLRGDMTVTAEACADGERRVVVVKLSLDVSSLMFEGEDGRFSNNFSTYLTLREAEGEDPLYQRYRLFNLTYTAEEYGRGDLRDPEIEQTFVAPCGPLSVEASVVDAVTGARADFERAVEQ